MIGHNCYLSVKDGTTLSIGDDCSFARNIKIMTSDGHSIFQDKKKINKSKDITIGKSVWIADNVTVLKGVNIGENSVIGINATVTKDVESNAIAVGNPAKTVKKNITWQE